MDDELATGFCDAANSELQSRVGNLMAEKMSHEEFDELEKLIDRGDEDAQVEYLEKVFPDYRTVAEEETARLEDEIKQISDKDSIKKYIKVWS